MAGKLPLVLLDLKPYEHCHNQGRLSPHHLDTFEVLGQLHPSQRPNVTFVRRFEDIRLHPGSKIVVLNPLDRVAHLPHLVDPEVHYELLSKRGLAYSGLPTPKTFVIDTVLGSKGDNSTEILNCPTKLSEEVECMIHLLRQRELPYIVKVPQSVGGLGTLIVRTESDRQMAETVLRAELLNMLQDVNPFNRHMYPCSLVVQEFVPGDTVGVSLFVTQQGRAIFIGCSTQNLDSSGRWAGGLMSYPDQPRLEKEYADVIRQIATYLHSKGYYGPVGADIMKDPATGRHLVIDLNVRVTGSYALGCLKNHFGKRGLSQGYICQFGVHCSRQMYLEHFRKEVEEGSLVLASWTPHLPDGSSLAVICIAAPDLLHLKQFVSRVEAFVLLVKPDGNVSSN
ncbi:hypothetical protein EYZ11_004687 [Aspergillus tanneri]|nr:hypothetical protein EYZ11_004687 [Aspergillus tanneri]